MEIIIVLYKDDIKTTTNGDRIVIKTKDGVAIAFTPDALEEFKQDIALLEKQKAKID